MKSVIIISDMNTESCAKKIQDALESASITFTMNAEKKVVVVEGNNDMVRNAKQILRNIGFSVL